MSWVRRISWLWLVPARCSDSCPSHSMLLKFSQDPQVKLMSFPQGTRHEFKKAFLHALVSCNMNSDAPILRNLARLALSCKLLWVVYFTPCYIFSCGNYSGCSSVSGDIFWYVSSLLGASYGWQALSLRLRHLIELPEYRGHMQGVHHALIVVRAERGTKEIVSHLPFSTMCPLQASMLTLRILSMDSKESWKASTTTFQSR